MSRRSQALICLLCGLLGFAFVVQVRTTQGRGPLAVARQDDLVRILDELAARDDRLGQEIDALQQTRDRLATGSERSLTAVEESRRRAETLGVLAGTLPAVGPGVVLTVAAGPVPVPAAVLLDALEELRDAGAEAVQVGPVRIGASSYLLDDPAGRALIVDGIAVAPPYRFLVIGNPRTLSAALAIPGGVLDTVRRVTGLTPTVETRDPVEVSALRPLEPPRYARPAP
ncbi:MAG: DUF881 domain-containing protein [Actinomycetota bacterium]|nr:DUF881 domain-containing protein [Actinomycetota bacterium]